MLAPGEPVPHFTGQSPSQPFNIGYMAGRFIALAFLPISTPLPEVRKFMAGLAAQDGLFDDSNCCFFGVLRHPEVIASAQDSPPGIRWFLDHDGEIFRHLEMFDAAGEEIAGWVVIDPMLRVLVGAPLSETRDILSWVAALPPPDEHAETLLPAPVLMVPRIFEPDFCDELIAHHVADGGARGLMANMEEGEFKPATLNEAYRRTMDFPIRDPDLLHRVTTRLSRRLCPEIFRAFCLNPEAVDGLAVVSYDGREEGRFRAHRANVQEESRHRQIAFSIPQCW